MNDIVKIFDTKNRKIIRTIDEIKNISCLCIGNNNNSLIIGCRDNSISVIDMKENRKRTISTTEDIYSLSAGNSADYIIAVGTYSGSLNIYRNFELIKSEKIHSKCVFSVSVSTNSELVFSGSVEKAVGWNMSSNKKDTLYYNNHVHSLFISPTGKYCVIGANDGSMDLMNLEGKSRLFTSKGEEQISTICFDKTNKRIIVGSSTNKIRSWDLRSGELLKYDQHTGGVTCLSLNLDEDVLVSGSKDRSVLIWDYPSGRVNRSFSSNENWVTSILGYLRDTCNYSPSSG